MCLILEGVGIQIGGIDIKHIDQVLPGMVLIANFGKPDIFRFEVFSIRAYDFLNHLLAVVGIGQLR